MEMKTCVRHPHRGARRASLASRIFAIITLTIIAVLLCVSCSNAEESGYPFIGMVVSDTPLNLYSKADADSDTVTDISKGMTIIAASAEIKESKSTSLLAWSHKSEKVTWVKLLFPTAGYLAFENSDISAAITKLDHGNCPPNYLSSASTLYACSYGNYWMRQWPIGTGEIGALVGGTPENEKIPIAISDLFVGEMREVSTWKSFIDATTSKSELKQRSKFEESRRLLAGGDFGQSDRAAVAMDSYPGQCTFEFMADINLVFDTSARKLVAAKPPPLRRPPPAVPAPQRRPPGPAPRVDSPSQGPDAGDKHVTLLNLGQGYTSDSFLKNGNAHHREWRGSQKWNTLMGRMACVSFENVDSSCLSLSLTLNRPGEGKGYHPDISTSAFKSYKTPASKDYSGQTVQRVGMSITSSRNALLPSTFMCVAMICHSGAAPYQSPAGSSWPTYRYSQMANNTIRDISKYLLQMSLADLNTRDDRASQTLGCNGATAREADIFVSVAKEPNEDALMRQINGQKSGSTASLEERCWKSVNGAVAEVIVGSLGTDYSHKEQTTTKVRRSVQFTRPLVEDELDGMYGRMSIVINPNKLAEIGFVAKNASLSSADASWDDQKIHSKDVKDDLLVATKLAPLLNMGRYMFIAGATKGPSNLQGAWADGRDAQWAGDYHLNINMQVDDTGIFSDSVVKYSSCFFRNRCSTGLWILSDFTKR
jgi:hypothetical protein